MKSPRCCRTTLLILTVVPCLLAAGSGKQVATSKLLPIDMSVLGSVPNMDNERKGWRPSLLPTNKMMPIDMSVLGTIPKMDNDRKPWRQPLVGVELSALNPSPHRKNSDDQRNVRIVNSDSHVENLPYPHRVKDALWDFLTNEANDDELMANQVPYDDPFQEEYADDYMYYNDDDNYWYRSDGDQSNIIPLTKKTDVVEEPKRNVFVSESWRPGGHANVAMKNIASQTERGRKADKVAPYTTVFGPNGWRLGYGKRAVRSFPKRMVVSRGWGSSNKPVLVSSEERATRSDKLGAPPLLVKQKWNNLHVFGSYW